jgi:hypothetical protein
MVANTANGDATGTQVGVKALTDGTVCVNTNSNTNLTTPFNYQVTANPTPAPLTATNVMESVTILNDSGGSSPTNDCYIGSASVTTGNGFRLVPGASLNIKVHELQSLYVVTNGGGSAQLYIIGV